MNNQSKQGPGNQHLQPLEDLLATGQADTYGQVCWSIANRGTEIHKAGDVIALEARDEGRVPVVERFQLTEVSINNIGRCIGMRTCGEAQALFAEPIVSEPTGVDCPHGHPEAAFAYMLYGIEPTEPCLRCGEIPNVLATTMMSPNFYSDEPIVGVDRREYEVCPQCGDDSLELEGGSLLDWGRMIACSNCDWKVKLIERLDIEQYCDLMEDVKSRIVSIIQLMEMPGITNRTRVESVSLQLRMLLELVVFSSLVSNKDVWQKSQKELQSSQNISRKLSELKRLHPDFYPKPVDLDVSTPGEEPVERAEGFLGQDKFIEVYGRLGGILHAENPLGREIDYRYYMDSIPEWIAQVQDLLDCHKVYLYHHPEEFYLVKMAGDADGELMCIPFKTTDTGETKCAWPDCVSSSARQYCEYIQHPWKGCRLPAIEPEQTLRKKIADEIDASAYEK